MASDKWIRAIAFGLVWALCPRTPATAQSIVREMNATVKAGNTIQAVSALDGKTFLATLTPRNPRRTQFVMIGPSDDTLLGEMKGMSAGRIIAAKRSGQKLRAFVGGGVEDVGETEYAYRLIELDSGCVTTLWDSRELPIPLDTESLVTSDPEMRWWAAAHLLFEGGKEAGVELLFGDLPDSSPRFRTRIEINRSEPPGRVLGIPGGLEGAYSVLPLDENSAVVLYHGRGFLISQNATASPTVLEPRNGSGSLLYYDARSDSVWVIEPDGNISVFFLGRHPGARRGGTRLKPDVIVDSSLLGFAPGPILGTTEEGLAIGEGAAHAKRLALLSVSEEKGITVQRHSGMPPHARAWIDRSGGRLVVETGSKGVLVADLGVLKSHGPKR